jgi:hypothetical protein
MNMKRGRMSAVPSMAVPSEPPLDTGSFVPMPVVNNGQPLSERVDEVARLQLTFRPTNCCALRRRRAIILSRPS